MIQPTSIKMPADLHLAIKDLADSEGRSMSNMIVYILRQYLKQKKED